MKARDNHGHTWMILGGACGLTGVALGAFGAHGLRSIVAPDMLAAFETGVRYQMYHACALLIAGILEHLLHSSFRSTAISFLAGIVLFSGSLYYMALTGDRWPGMVTPFGGIAFLAGWFELIRHTIRHRSIVRTSGTTP